LANSIPDLYIETGIASASQPGGTVNLGNPAGYTDGDTIKIRCNQPLPSVRVSNNTTATVTSEVKSDTYSLNILGDLTIDNSAKFSMATNNLDLSVSGNFNMNTSGAYGGLVNTTYLNGSATQTLTSSGGNFYNLQVSNTGTGSVLLAGSGITVNNNLILDQGTFDLQTSAVHLKRNLMFNSGKSTNSTGYISFEDPTYIQYIEGSTGEVGSIVVNKTNQNVRLSTNLWAHKGLTFTKGYLDVDMNTLFVESSTAMSEGTQTEKIKTPGTINGGKVVVVFNGGSALSSKVIPVGAQDRYTPVYITTSQSDNNARLEIKPVFAPNPYIVDAEVASALQYYWSVNASSGYTFPSSSAISFVFKWDDLPSSMVYGDATTFQPACLHNSTWCLFATGVNSGSKTIAFTGIRADTLNGDYTAGAKDAFRLIPTVFTSVQSGVLTDRYTWDQNGETPGKGDIIRIVDNDIVSFDKSSLNLSASFIDSLATLEFENTSILNNIGTVTGKGTMVLKNNGLQDGTYDAFFSTAGGTLEYRNLNSSTMNITDNATTFNNLAFSNTNTTPGAILLPGTSFEVLGSFNIKSGTLNGSASAKTIKLNGSFINNGIFNANSLSLDIKGSTNQYFTGSGTNNFYKLLLNKNSGGDLYVNTTNPIMISNSVSFNVGKIGSTGSGAISFNSGAGYTLNANHLSYAMCKVNKVANNETFIFPVGDKDQYRPVETNSAFTGTANVQYFKTVPLPYNVSDSDLMVNEFEYWDVGVSTTTNNFTFRWTDNDQLPLSGSDLTKLRLARWDVATSKWVEVAGTTYTGNTSAGTITATGIPTGTTKYAFAAMQKMEAYCPNEVAYFVADPVTSGTGTVVYKWTLVPSNAGVLTVDPTDNKKANVAFNGTNPNIYDKARLTLKVWRIVGVDSTLMRQKSYKLITYPRTPALNLPSHVCSNTDVRLSISNQYQSYVWSTDTDSDPSSGLTTVKSGSNPATDSYYDVNTNTDIYINVQGSYTFIDSKGDSYKTCPSLLLNPNKLIKPTTVTPEGLYRKKNQ
jgi:hypothetical protein